MASLTFESVTKSFGALVAVNNVSFDVRDGEFFTLLGPSGCGKTTTLRMLAGFLTPDVGTIRVGGEVVSSPGQAVPPEKRDMGMVFQSYAVWPHMNVFENVSFGLKMRKVSRDRIRPRVREVLDLVELGGLSDRYPTQLSGGQQQRVALARALAVEPDILLLDEPLSNLDAKLRESMRFELKDIQRKTGVTAIYVTHDQAEAMVLSDRILVMEQGAVHQIGPPDAIYSRPATRFVAGFIGISNFLSGTLDAVDPCVVTLNRGWSLRAILSGNHVVGDQVSVAVRPEDIEIAAEETEGDQVNVLPGIIERATYLGERMTYNIELGSNSIRVDTHPTVRFDLGQKVCVRIDPERCLVV